MKLFTTVVWLLSFLCWHIQAEQVLSPEQQQVFAAERAFAKSMADRDLKAFEQHLSDDAIFFGEVVLKGKAAVVEGWKTFYQHKTAPFSWEPTQVEVLQDGTLALSSGPVKDPSGKVIATFSSVWRQEQPGVWKVVFDKGCGVCHCDKKT
ncbi:MAG: nuclear transport factor 2 family protein [Gammaproteobacteria bacterium]|nr:nuclear transport factor 2 family protein [Gammaproteobacteria bacterium]MBU2058258.1 nuclear transport factor 2 family protein [Gammaproteobacteria bacterium]MBU2176428.1 nuclear transport factor 2 family protein [Gammaproteobacteria bacterium]MBU2246353.1 nuclear transport factor 2 family protein [Gammaproteobacteria bacterium]MBU2342875.1 nuclear transport factor 2 family protein [Gammaproteobacteria bacterium]